MRPLPCLRELSRVLTTQLNASHTQKVGQHNTTRSCRLCPYHTKCNLHSLFCHSHMSAQTSTRVRNAPASSRQFWLTRLAWERGYRPVCSQEFSQTADASRRGLCALGRESAPSGSGAMILSAASEMIAAFHRCRCANAPRSHDGAVFARPESARPGWSSRPSRSGQANVRNGMQRQYCLILEGGAIRLFAYGRRLPARLIHATPCYSEEKPGSLCLAKGRNIARHGAWRNGPGPFLERSI
jgi:hypothetical protein